MEYDKYAYAVGNEAEKLQKLNAQHFTVLKSINEIPLEQAAVLLPIFTYDGRPHVILTERSNDLRTHAGHVALPGGKVDFEDNTVTETALRETEEEIGLDRKHVEIIGESFPLPSIRPKVVITPVVGFVQDIEAVTLKINKEEVSSVFAVPLQFFSQNTELHFYTYNGANYSDTRFKWDSREYLKSIKTKLSQTTSSCLHELFSFDRTFKIYGITGMILNFYAAKVFNKPMALSKSGDDIETFDRKYLMNTLTFVKKLEKNKL